MTNTEEAARLLARLFEAQARQVGKTLSQAARADIDRICQLLASAGEELETVFEELPPVAPRQSPGEHAIADPDFQQWRARQRGGER